MRFFIRASELLGFSSRLIFITLPILSSRVVGLGRLHPTSSRLNTDNKDGRNLRNVFSYFFPFISFNSSISFNSKKTKSEYKKIFTEQQHNKQTSIQIILQLLQSNLLLVFCFTFHCHFALTQVIVLQRKSIYSCVFFSYFFFIFALIS